jgi:hypothetical protein
MCLLVLLASTSHMPKYDRNNEPVVPGDLVIVTYQSTLEYGAVLRLGDRSIIFRHLTPRGVDQHRKRERANFHVAYGNKNHRMFIKIQRDQLPPHALACLKEIEEYEANRAAQRRHDKNKNA